MLCGTFLLFPQVELSAASVIMKIPRKMKGDIVEKTKTDVVLKEFWRDNAHFADLFNTVLFEGKEVLKPEDLQEMDTDVSGIIEMKNYKETLNRTRDVIKKTAYGAEFVLVGLELQGHVHYAMPLRHMLYDGMSYLKEYREISGKSTKDGMNYTKDEFLSKMRKEDRLHPVVSLTIYYGEKIWDGPYSLKDMLTEMPEEIAGVISDYKMNLLEIRKSGSYRFNNRDVQAVFEISREALEGNLEFIRRKYRNQNLPSQVAAVVGKIVKSEELVDMSQQTEVINMCAALDRLKQEGVQEGLEQGKLILIMNMLKKGMEVKDILYFAGVSEEEVEEAKKLLE